MGLQRDETDWSLRNMRLDFAGNADVPSALSAKREGDSFLNREVKGSRLRTRWGRDFRAPSINDL
jgi:hypothetical protein